ncbi:hypothetical protein [Cellulomonas sp. URHE0023]|uniref:hypothetical protein n=1 Tax=Cellulomonas sp. URHE0023 TaxID=1380354 RepID=UPI00048385FE|nr:hypothetical protein [Cellulomonas sp. URHE0023]
MALPRSTPRTIAPNAGVVLYVSLPQQTPHAVGALAEAAEVLQEFARELLPGADTYAALSLAPAGSDEIHRLGDRLTHLRLLGSAEDGS